MNNQVLDSQFLFPNALSALGNFLLNFSESSYFSMCIKDTKTKQVCMSNKVCEKQWGLSQGEIVGKTARDILTRVKGFTNVEEVLATLEKTEQEAIANEQQSVYTETALTYEGFVKIRRMIIIPLYGVRSKPIATVGCGLDITQNLNLPYLLDLYKRYYTKSKAIQQFSEHLNLQRYFFQPLCYEELRVLVSMIKDSRHKSVAKVLEISPKTVAGYSYSIKDKLKPNIDIYMVVSNLRDYQQWHFAL